MIKSKTIVIGLLVATMGVVLTANSSASIFSHPNPTPSATSSDPATGTNTYVASSAPVPVSTAKATVATPMASSNLAVGKNTYIAPSIPVGPGSMSTYTVQSQPAPGSCHYRYTADKQPLPDVKCTPGATNPAVTQTNLSSTICMHGYTKTIRPSAYITGKEKKANALSYGYTGSLRTFEYDHEISLELGGDPNDPRNLWVEPASPGHTGNSVTNPKDGVENKIKTAVCSGKITLKQAQQAIVNNWTTALSTLGIN